MKNQKMIRTTVLSLAMVFIAFAAYAENVSISTYYPSPYGSYQTIETTAGTSLATTSGNVGIGVSAASANAKLEVNGNMRVTTSAQSVLSNNFETISPTTTAQLFPAQTSGNIIIGSASTSGNVGVGKSPGAYKLDVNGAVNATSIRVVGVNGQAGVVQVSCDGTSCWPVYA